MLRLKHQNQLSIREIAGSCGLPASTVGDYLHRAQAAGLSWPLPAELSDEQLAERLRGGPPPEAPSAKPPPEWRAVREQLGR